MSPQKIIKDSFNPILNKNPKSKGDPAQYKNLNVSWQIGLIDFEGDWGYWSFSELIKFKITEYIENEVVGKISDEFHFALLEINNTKFKNISDLYDKLKQSAINESDINNISTIISNVKRNFFVDKIYPKLKEFENKNWYEIEQELFFGMGRNKTKHHSIKISDLSSAAQKRLTKLRITDVDSIFSLRLEGKLRIFGIRKFNYLQILWVDRNHEVCPST